MDPKKIKINHPFVKEAWFYKEKTKCSIHVVFYPDLVAKAKLGTAKLEIPFYVEQMDFEIKI